MSPSLEEVAAQIAHACETADKAGEAFAHALESLQDALAQFAHIMDGSVDPAAETTYAYWRQALDGIQELTELLDDATVRTRAYLTSLNSPTHAEPDVQQLERTPPPQARPHEIDQESVDRLRGELPPPILDQLGPKTHGRWIGPDGKVRPIMSGRDEMSTAADARMRQLGMTRPITKTSDVEIKLVMEMLANGIEHATVVINHEPCKGRLSCDTLVPILLPEGATLTVYGTTRQGMAFRKRYTGGARPWWR